MQTTDFHDARAFISAAKALTAKAAVTWLPADEGPYMAMMAYTGNGGVGDSFFEHRIYRHVFRETATDDLKDVGTKDILAYMLV